LSASPAQNVVFRVTGGEAGQRLDKLVVARASVGRRRASELFAASKVRVDGVLVRKSALAREGALVEVELGEPLELADEALPELDVRLETPELVVVSKPAGQPSVTLRGGRPNSLAAALIRRYPEMSALPKPLEAGLLHRLDTWTSGLLIAARSPSSFERLGAALRAGAIDKRYLAIVESEGLPGSGLIDSPLAVERGARRVTVASHQAQKVRAAETHWRVVRRAGRWALVEIEAPRALRHQIRAHLSSIGRPLAGDVLYGGARLPELGERHALHASHVGWSGDENLRGFSVDDALPADLRGLLEGGPGA